MLKHETVQSTTQGASPEKISKMEERNRKTGIDVVGDAPFGKHFCLFYETKEDLIDVLVSYFKAGLESNEFCMWVTSEPLGEEEAKEAMRRAVPNFDGYVEREQIEIVPYTEWYLKGGVFNLQRVLNGWVEKLNQALAKGYDGMRLTGNTAWLEKRDWKNFVDYEQEINRVIGKYRMMALCTYSLDKCGASEVIDVVRNHQFAVIKQEGERELIESSEFKRAEVSLRETEERYRELTESISDVFFAMDKDLRYTYWNKASEKLTGISAKDAVGKSLTEVFPDVKGTKIEQFYLETLRTQQPKSYLNKYQVGGKAYVFEINTYPTKTGLSVFAKDITERKKMEEEIKSLARFPSENPNPVLRLNREGVILYANDAGKTLLQDGGREVVDRTPKFWRDVVVETLNNQSGKRFDIKLGKQVYSIIVTPVMGADYANIYGIDITERKKVEDTLLKSEKKYRALVEVLNEGIWVIDKDAYTTFVNPRMAEMLGYTVDEMQGKHLFSFMDEKGVEIAKHLLGRRKQGIQEQHDFEFVRKDGKRIYAVLETTPLTDENGNYMGAIAGVMDVTERRKTEEALRESDEKLRNVFVTSPDAITVTDLNGNIVDCNQATVDLHGYQSREGLLGKNSLEFIAKKDHEKAIMNLKKTLEQGSAKNVEYTFLTKDGREFLGELSASVVRDASGKPEYFVAITKNITERKKVEQALRASLERYQSFIEVTGELGWTTNADGEVAEDIPSFRNFTGQTCEEITGWGWLKALHPDDLERTASVWKEATETKSKYEVEYRLRRHDGVYRYFLARGVPVLKEDGSIREWVGTCIDITERKMAEEKLEESEKKFKSIFEGARDGILAADAKTKKFVLANPRICEITGYSEKELLRLGVEDIHPEKDLPYVIDAFTKMLQRKIEIGRDMPVLRKDRNVIYCDINAYLLEIGERKLLVGLFRDVTERKNMEEQLKDHAEHLEEKVEERTKQLKQAQEQLLKAEKLAAMGEVAAMVGHDLRNPLQVITNTLYLSGKKSKFITITEKEILEKHGFSELRSGLKEQVEYMDKIVSDLQDYARPLKLMPVEIGLHQLINKMLSSLTVPENVKVSIVIEADFPKLMLDPILMQRLFSNLITNAVQAMPNGGQLTIRASRKGETALISVEDTGGGIPDENLSKLFTPLFTTKAKGQGFGLAVCKRMVEVHDGTITVESKVGKGSTFTVEIPLRKEVS